METWKRSRQVQGTVSANVLGQKRAHLPFPGNGKGSSIIRSIGEETEALRGDSTCPRSHNPGKSPGATYPTTKTGFQKTEMTEWKQATRRREGRCRAKVIQLTRGF